MNKLTGWRLGLDISITWNMKIIRCMFQLFFLKQANPKTKQQMNSKKYYKSAIKRGKYWHIQESVNGRAQKWLSSQRRKELIWPFTQNKIQNPLKVWKYWFFLTYWVLSYFLVMARIRHRGDKTRQNPLFLWNLQQRLNQEILDISHKNRVPKYFQNNFPDTVLLVV